MIIPDTPHMDPEGLDAFMDAMSRSTGYLEYGCGGSTLYAARRAKVKKIISVETDISWYESMASALADTEMDVFLNYCDIGQVANWGRPISSEGLKRYHRYMSMPWKVARENGVSPDTVLVDGRFRVASFLYTLVAAEEGTLILFDDYVDREYYHLVERYLAPDRVCGRMALFRANKKVDLPELVSAIAQYAIDPA